MWSDYPGYICHRHKKAGTSGHCPSCVAELADAVIRELEKRRDALAALEVGSES